jgi:hypothetical protein
MAHRRGTSQRKRTEWLAVTLDDSLSTTAATNRIFTETILDEKGPFTVMRMIINWSAQGNLSADTGMLFIIGVRKVVLDRTSDVVAQIGGTLFDANYAASDQLLFMKQEALSPGWETVNSSDVRVSAGRPGAAGIWDVKAKRKLNSPNETLVLDTEVIGVGSSDDIRLRAVLRILIQPH